MLWALTPSGSLSLNSSGEEPRAPVSPKFSTSSDDFAFAAARQAPRERLRAEPQPRTT